MLFIDILLGIVLPVHILYTIHAPRRIKLVAGFVLSLGSFASVATIARLAYTASVDKDDILYTINVPFLWGGLELGICIFCTSATTLKPLLAAMKLFHSKSDVLEPRNELQNGSSRPTKAISLDAKGLFSAPGKNNGINARHSSPEEIIWDGKDATKATQKNMNFDLSSE
ncbi:uncharacterized protein PV09_03249 [Verruconis gallopava]|uniref:Rhodopsin domain-containing protein n=1 Tax=Verruconis gallopava TaxID=253628 RepID=A0A0D2AGN9_9PEZI|nr:uncharacterized protein PV09_03249 [Verruconis gallopava]KIW06078.1 hypothetical protein PV09_03249 [Verruconis gallopava]